ncbi:BnaC08g45950D [Brassica napus]|uniref:BnaC08g45950D protein n=1 Tax=Brassica napus TaxID=3708 RepID=A0A078HHX7_BRANA|nr:BnaC08g45950D [Brassica napus]
MARGVAVKSSAKKKGVAFVIDCSKPVDDEIMEIATLEKFLQERIKVGGKPGALGDSVSITKEKGKITVTADSNFSKRYITSLLSFITFKYNIRDWLRVVASNKDRNMYELRYFNIEDDSASDE